jgi:hypothetical protein
MLVMLGVHSRQRSTPAMMAQTRSGGAAMSMVVLKASMSTYTGERAIS